MTIASCPVVENEIIAEMYCRLTVHAPALAWAACPGQFVMVYMPPAQGHMLPRPFSIFSSDKEKGEFSLLFAVKGRGTMMLAAAQPGLRLKLLGPLGRGFPPLPAQALLAAGGMGIAPLAFLAASTEKQRTLLYGARTAAQLICPPAALNLPGLTVREATEDGSRGEKGSVIDLLPRLIPEAKALFACGPNAMLRAVADLSRHYGLETWFSLEEKMACGIGACRGCAVHTSEGYRPVCSDGPVFAAGEVKIGD